MIQCLEECIPMTQTSIEDFKDAVERIKKLKPDTYFLVAPTGLVYKGNLTEIGDTIDRMRLERISEIIGYLKKDL